MGFKIAVASTDGITINEHFGSAAYFHIFNVYDDCSYENEGIREIIEDSDASEEHCKHIKDVDSCKETACTGQTSGGCGEGHSDVRIQSKVALISDCRCLICAQCGPGAERQLEKKAITTFQVRISTKEALEKIISYYTKIDNHISLRKSI